MPGKTKHSPSQSRSSLSASSTRKDDYDPITDMLEPPADETETEKNRRLERERRERQISDEIDEEINRVRAAERKGPKATKILLLGQSESGKSTTLKNFQMLYSPKAFRAERGSWRAIIQLNLVRNVRTLLDQISLTYDARTPYLPNSPESSSYSHEGADKLDTDLLHLRLRLAPVIKIEESLMRRINPTMVDSYHNDSGVLKRGKELAVNSFSPWRAAFTKLGIVNAEMDSFASEDVIDWDDPEDPGVVLSHCCEDIEKLWGHPTMKKLLESQNIRLEEMGGFFLDCVREVTAPKYVPTNDHVLRARIKTLGITEHHFQLEGGHYCSFISFDSHCTIGECLMWAAIDLCPSHVRREVHDIEFRNYSDTDSGETPAAWVPYFDDIDWILFLVPISAFDQVLEEAPKVNRLEDSVNLWRYIVSNPLLKSSNIILFMNKIDIMRSKLESGIKLADHVVSYADKPNDLEHTSAYLKRKFSGIMEQASPRPRKFYCFLTSVTNTASTTLILNSFKDMALQNNLKKSHLLV